WHLRAPACGPAAVGHRQRRRGHSRLRVAQTRPWPQTRTPAQGRGFCFIAGQDCRCFRRRSLTALGITRSASVAPRDPVKKSRSAWTRLSNRADHRTKQETGLPVPSRGGPVRARAELKLLARVSNKVLSLRPREQTKKPRHQGGAFLFGWGTRIRT